MSQLTIKERFAQGVEMMSQARSVLNEILDDPDLQFIRLAVDADLMRAQNKLAGAGGHAVGTSHLGMANVEHVGSKPVTTILGVDVTSRRPVTSTELTASPTEKAAFLAKRNDFLEKLTQRSNEDLLDDLIEPGMETIFRSAASKLGIDDYRTVDIDIDLISRMRAAKLKQDADAAASSEAELETIKLKGMEDSNNLDEQMNPGSVTEPANNVINEPQSVTEPVQSVTETAPADKTKAAKK